MPEQSVTVTRYTCTRCGHSWIARAGKPQRCASPRCRSPYFDRERKQPRNSAATSGKGG